MTKIAIGYYSSGGVGAYIRAVTKILVENGKTVDILSSETVDDSFKQYVMNHGGTIVEIPKLNHPVSQFHSILKRVKSEKYDAAYYNISEAFNGVGILAAKKAGIPQIIVHSHASGCDRRNLAVRKIRFLLNKIGKYFFIPYATTFFSCSDKASDWLFPKKIINAGKVIFVPNSIDTEKFIYSAEIRSAIRSEFNLENKFVVGYAGSFKYVKNVCYFLKVAKLLRDTNIIFLMIGDGEEKEMLEKQIKQNCLQDKFIFTGFREDVSRLMNAMDLFMLPSLYEGLPFVAVEAQQNGLPVLLSDTITRMVDVNHGCTYLPLSKSAIEWKNEILQHTKDVRHQGDRTAIEEKFGADTMKKILLHSIK